MLFPLIWNVKVMLMQPEPKATKGSEKAVCSSEYHAAIHCSQTEPDTALGKKAQENGNR